MRTPNNNLSWFCADHRGSKVRDAHAHPKSCSTMACAGRHEGSRAGYPHAHHLNSMVSAGRHQGSRAGLPRHANPKTIGLHWTTQEQQSRTPRRAHRVEADEGLALAARGSGFGGVGFLGVRIPGAHTPLRRMKASPSQRGQGWRSPSGVVTHPATLRASTMRPPGPLTSRTVVTAPPPSPTLPPAEEHQP